MPSNALNAGSTSPPLAVSTARITAKSIAGNASLSVFCACSRALTGRGGLVGGASSLGGGGGTFCFEGVVVAVVVSCSSSKSRGCAVVGDSGCPSPSADRMGETGESWIGQFEGQSRNMLRTTRACFFVSAMVCRTSDACSGMCRSGSGKCW